MAGGVWAVNFEEHFDMRCLASGVFRMGEGQRAQFPRVLLTGAV